MIGDPLCRLTDTIIGQDYRLPSRFFFLQQFIPLSGQDFELGFLFGNPLRNQFVVGGAGICGRLLYELADIFPDSRHAPFDFSQRQWNFDHENSVIVVRNAATYRRFDLQRLPTRLKYTADHSASATRLAAFAGLFEFVAYETFHAAIGVHRLIQFTIKSGSGRGRFQLLCA